MFFYRCIFHFCAKLKLQIFIIVTSFVTQLCVMVSHRDVHEVPNFGINKSKLPSCGESLLVSPKLKLQSKTFTWLVIIAPTLPLVSESAGRLSVGSNTFSASVVINQYCSFVIITWPHVWTPIVLVCVIVLVLW